MELQQNHRLSQFKKDLRSLLKDNSSQTDITIHIFHLENNGSLNYTDFPNIDTFHYNIF